MYHKRVKLPRVLTSLGFSPFPSPTEMADGLKLRAKPIIVLLHILTSPFLIAVSVDITHVAIQAGFMTYARNLDES